MFREVTRIGTESECFSLLMRHPIPQEVIRIRRQVLDLSATFVKFALSHCDKKKIRSRISVSASWCGSTIQKI